MILFIKIICIIFVIEKKDILAEYSNQKSMIPKKRLYAFISIIILLSSFTLNLSYVSLDTSPVTIYDQYKNTLPIHRDDQINLYIKPVALVYCKLFFDFIPINITTWSLLSVQEHLMITGIPYQIYEIEEFLTKDLDSFSVIVFVDSTYINASLFNLLYEKLDSFIAHGGSVITMDYPPTIFEDSSYNGTILTDIFNANVTDYYTNRSFTVIAGDLPTLSMDYSQYELLWNYSGNNMDYFVVDFINSSLEHYVIAWANDSNTLYPLAIATDFGNGKSVYFTMHGYYEWIDSTLLLTRTLQWCIFDDLPPVSLLLTPGNLSWMFTVDADLTSITGITVNATSILLNISQEYLFPFSWGIVTGPHPPGMAPNWTELKPYYDRIVEYGHELAGHSRTHPTWKYIDRNDTERVESEVGGCKEDILGNMSIEIEVFHTPDGYFYEVWYPILAEHYNFTITVGSEMARVMGGFYFSHIAKDFLIFWRPTESDYDYFHVLNLNSSEILAHEMHNFMHFYEFYRSLPYINLWHDYTINNKTRLPVLLEILKKQLIETSGVYTILPKELGNKISILRDIRYNVSYNEDSIIISVDTCNISPSMIKYASNLAFLIENGKEIKSVLINDQPHYLFSKHRVILPESESREIFNITVNFGTPETPHVLFSELFITHTTLSATNFSIHVSNTSRRLGRIQVQSPKKPKFVFIGDEYYTHWDFQKNILLINVSTLNGPVDIVLYYDGEINILDAENTYLYLPDDATTEYVNFTIYVQNTLNHSIPLYGITYLKTKHNQTLSEYGLTVIIPKASNTSITLYVKKPYATWHPGNYSVQVVLTDNSSLTISKSFRQSIRVIDTVAHMRGIIALTVGAILVIVPVIVYFVYIRYRRSRRHKKELEEKAFGWLEKDMESKK